MDPRETASWLMGRGLNGTGLGGSSFKPALPEAYAVYLGLFAPRRASATMIGPVADFAEVLRMGGNDVAYSDEEWIAFLLPYTGDYDAARDMWDALLCQPSYSD